MAAATLSQIRAWSTQHLTDAAGYWSKTADQWEDTFLTMRNQSRSLASPLYLPDLKGGSIEIKNGWWAGSPPAGIPLPPVMTSGH